MLLPDHMTFWSICRTSRITHRLIGTPNRSVFLIAVRGTIITERNTFVAAQEKLKEIKAPMVLR